MELFPSMLLICPSKTVGYANIACWKVMGTMTLLGVRGKVISCTVGVDMGFG